MFSVVTPQADVWRIGTDFSSRVRTSDFPNFQDFPGIATSEYLHFPANLLPMKTTGTPQADVWRIGTAFSLKPPIFQTLQIFQELPLPKISTFSDKYKTPKP